MVALPVEMQGSLDLDVLANSPTQRPTLGVDMVLREYETVSGTKCLARSPVTFTNHYKYRISRHSVFTT
jgi:hypothetical protein